MYVELLGITISHKSRDLNGGLIKNWCLSLRFRLLGNPSSSIYSTTNNEDFVID
jgi:hypothetical protein